MQQYNFPFAIDPPARAEETPDLDSYDYAIIAFSAGKDSISCVLHLLDQGFPKNRIELWHHDIDDRHSGTDPLMDWPVTPAYCRAFAEAFDLPIYFSGKVGGFEREMCRDNAPTAPTRFETPDGLREVGGKGPCNTRKMFPQVSADLRVRWCSAYAKVDVCAAAIRNQERFHGKRILVITGERGEESSNRARYASFEPDRSDARTGRLKRHVDRWRPVLDWDEAAVWEIIERYRVNPHPCYHLGYGRASCALCIFCSRDQIATSRAILPSQFNRVSSYETQWGKTIHRTESIQQRADAGTVHAAALGSAWVDVARSSEFTLPIILPEGEWTLPAGAFGESRGPT